MGDPLAHPRETAFRGAIDKIRAPASITGHRADHQQRAGALLFEYRRGGKALGGGAGEIGLYQRRRRARIALQFGLIAEKAIGEQQNIEAAERLDHFGEFHASVRGCAIERDEIGGDGVPAILIGPADEVDRIRRVM